MSVNLILTIAIIIVIAFSIDHWRGRNNSHDETQPAINREYFIKAEEIL
jgi:hypothetical protein